MKVICGLGNPGPEYDATRHNVGWWVVERLGREWGFGRFRRTGPALTARGSVGDQAVLLMKPVTFMNRSGAALVAFPADPGIDITKDLLVIVDDAALDVGRVRFRPAGSAGGHNGLKSVEAALGTRDYARLRIGVGAPPPGADLSDWVLSGFEPAEQEVVLALMPDLVAGVRLWIEEGVDAARSRHNR